MAEDEARKVSGEPDSLISQFSEWDRRIDNHWAPWRKETRQCYDMVAGRQWDKTDEDRLKDAHRLAPVFNKLSPLIDAVSGAEIMGRQEVRYYPRQVGASATNEVLTKGAAWIRDRCDADQEESEAFRDSFICGLGVTETVMDYDEDPAGQIVINRVDPMEMGVDPGHRKSNCVDARFIRRRKTFTKEAYEEAFPELALAGGPGDEGDARFGFGVLKVNNPRNRYQNEDELDLENPEDGEVIVDEYQWFETEPFYVIEDPETGERLEATEDEYAELEAEFAALQMALDGVKQRRRRYYRAFVCGSTLLGEVEELADGEFTYKFITGKRDRNKRQWYGLVRPMLDPQRWLNQFLSQLLAIMAASTKGGVLHEEGAIEDTKAFDESYAAIGGRTVVASGALSSGAVQQKQAAPYPNGVDRLLTIASDALRETTGVNPELLGMVDRDQAGVLEHQRKQAAYGILACYFDAFRRYRRVQGRLMLKLIRYLPEDYLVRINRDDTHAEEYVYLIQTDDDLTKFDVIVDEAPAGPNQKTQVWGMIMQLMPYLKDADLPGSFWADVARYSPFPNELASKMAGHLAEAENEPPDPVMMANVQADLRQKNAGAAKDEAQAAESVANTEKTNAEGLKEIAEAYLMQAQAGVIFPPDHVGMPQ